jgi:hypothetical protein
MQNDEENNEEKKRNDERKKERKLSITEVKRNDNKVRHKIYTHT